MAIGQGADLFKVFALVSELWICVITCNIELGKGHTVVSECARKRDKMQAGSDPREPWTWTGMLQHL